ncbi:MAG: hypothetical protein H7249_01015 [Chitinophagaceae bacterium]|nr:hypothetical protein [Oligoflexus sp.]
MKLNFLALSLVLSTSAFAKPYELRSVPNDQVDTHMAIGSDATNTPPNLQGLWWMDGNPLADEVVSFASTSWSDTVENGQIVAHTAVIPVYDQGIWAWHDSKPGRALYNAVYDFHLVYQLTFNLDYTFGQVIPVIKPIPFLPSVDIKSSVFVDFTMTQVNDNEFRRDSILAGKHSSYRFRRIVDANGVRLPAFDEYLQKAEVKNILLPYCKTDKSGELPTACAQ